MYSSERGRMQYFISLHPQKASAAIDVTPSGMTIFLSDLQPKKHLHAISFIFLLKVTFFILSQFINDLRSITVTLSGMFTSRRFLALINALHPIFFKVLGKDIFLFWSSQNSYLQFQLRHLEFLRRHLSRYTLSIYRQQFRNRSYFWFLSSIHLIGFFRECIIKIPMLHKTTCS